ncbi:MAG: hypothetical protein H6939_04655 [Burkholderiales bacterium]|nr:hypothetical protein [Burkholderiales bacterium]HQU61794.1 hypothetical protein [Nitrosomonas sp.]
MAGRSKQDALILAPLMTPCKGLHWLIEVNRMGLFSQNAWPDIWNRDGSRIDPGHGAFWQRNPHEYRFVRGCFLQAPWRQKMQLALSFEQASVINE